MDKEWIKLPRYSSEYIDGVEFFLNYAYTNGKPQGGEILCPCAKCHNTCWEVRAIVYDHLIGKRGKTKCLEAHARSLEDRVEIILNEYEVPIGPNQRSVVQFSNFLGTVARSSDFCPLVYTNWKVVPDKDLIWTYIKQKYIIPDVGKKAIFAIINDAWRRHKCAIKEEHFTKYKTTYERLKNRPKDIPESHFKELIRYWSLGNIQVKLLNFSLC
ncbi:unnamed protein product [Lupinus luteus]|uniref:Transposase-associated domain-containing protein n=1 Tax=Lupinus luteus TaxID=3873 RepID=A0AAV1XIC5_LUPLU